MSTRIVLIVAVVLLLISLIGLGQSFASPLDRSVKQQVKLLDYAQEGSFTYEVSSRPSFFHDGVSPTTSDAIPTIAIQSFDVTFGYKADRPAAGITVNAVLESPGVWTKTVPLATANQTGAQSVSFPVNLKTLQDTADAINKEMGSGGAALDLTLEAVVPGGAVSVDGRSSDFVQVLPLKMTRTSLRIGDSLDYSAGGASGHFGYQVKMGENALYGPIILSSPPATSSPLVMLGPADTIFVKLIDSLKVYFSYRLTASQPLGKVDTVVKIEAIAANPEKWSKTFTLLPSTPQGVEFTVSVPLDLKQFGAIFDTIQQESGLAASNEELTLLATVHAVAQTAQGAIDKTYTRSIKTNLRDGVMTWAGDLKKTEPGSIETTQLVVQQTRLLGLPVLGVRVISAVLAAIALILLGFFIRMSRARRPDEAAQDAKVAGDIGRKYKAMMVEVANVPERRFGEGVVPVASMEDLVKVSQGLLKPVHHTAEDGKHVYWVYDESKRYEYRLANGRVRRDVPSSPESPFK